MAPKKVASKKRVATRATAKKAVSKSAASKSAVSKRASATPSVKEVLSRLEELATPKIREEMETRYGIRTADRVLGIAVGTLQKVAKEIGKNHAIALDLWETGCYEARMLASFVDEADQVTSAQMDAWCSAFDNWGICDTVCFKLFDQTPCAFAKIHKWCKLKGEFQRRGGFALLACVALHQKEANEDDLAKCLPLIESAAKDERNFVKKGVNWALRALGHVRSQSIRQAALELAKRLAASKDATSRWIGKDALKSLEKTAKKKAK